MPRVGFLSHADASLYLFRRPIMRALKELGCEIFAIAPEGKYLERLKSEFNCVTYELNRASLNPLRVLSNTHNLAKVLSELNLDLLQTNAHKSNIFGTFAARKAGIKFVINLVEGLGSFYIDNDMKTRAVRLILERLYKISFKKADACVFVNDADPDYFIFKNLITKDKVKRIKSVGIDTAKFNPEIIKKADIKSDKKIVLMIARAMWHKGVREFYEAAQILKGRADCEFIYVGGFDDNKSSVDLEFLKSGAVRYLGARDDIAELLKASYLLALPSYKEGFPRTILEAMSMARAVVASDVSGCAEAVRDGFNGLLCKPKDSADLARKIEILLDDENLAQKMGENGRKWAQAEFDEKIITQRYIEFYRNFIDV